MRHPLGLRFVSSLFTLGLALLFAAATSPLAIAEDYDEPPISYRSGEPDNVLSRLQAKIESGQVKLEYDDELGYLPAVLKALEIPVDSQMLVFSKTSLQLRRISPKSPRAIYFNDDVYLGYCQAGDVLELSVADPKLGTVFYTIEQHAGDKPQIERHTDRCLICHSSSRTENVPGHLVRSLFVDEAGQPIFSAGSQSVDHTTPLEKRWGGWYVTGTHGSQKHLGNLIVPKGAAPYEVNNDAGQNVVKLDAHIDVRRYPTPHSDIVALMVLEHQTLVHNRLTKASFATRQALDYEAKLNEALGEPPTNRFESTTRRIQNAGDDLVEALLLVDEVPLTEPIVGTSGYAERFSKQGPHDSQGRSLRQLDLKRRLFQYPCSYLIYSESFDQLPDEMLQYVWRRLWDILTADEPPKEFRHLSAEDRQAIIEILRDTKPNLPDYWRS